MASRLVLLVCNFPLEKKMAQVSKPFKLWFDEELANFGVNFIIEDVLFNYIDKILQTLYGDGILCRGPKEKHHHLLSIIIRACCCVGNFVVDLIVGISDNYKIIIFL
jgi:hypothetical protein